MPDDLVLKDLFDAERWLDELAEAGGSALVEDFGISTRVAMRGTTPAQQHRACALLRQVGDSTGRQHSVAEALLKRSNQA